MRKLLTMEEYLAEVLALVSPDARSQLVPLGEAYGRVLAAALVSQADIPRFDNSQMDGFAVRFAEVGRPLRVVGEVNAGDSADVAAGPGECARIMTGAPIPAFADTIVPIEDTDATGWDDVGAQITVRRAPERQGAFVRHAGDDIHAGSPLAAAGDVLTPALVAALGAAGIGQVPVRPLPRVAVCSTGDEVVSGRVFDSNTCSIAAALARDGAEPTRHAPIPDDPERLRVWLDAADADLIVLTGGVSMGARDIVRDVLAPVGEFRHLRMQPGKPQGWAVWNSIPILALPGNPLSALLSYELFAGPAVFHILGRRQRPWFDAAAGETWDSPPGRRQIMPVVWEGGRVRPAHALGSQSHVITSLAAADAIAMVPEDVTRVTPGLRLRVQLLR
ncbi:MAG: molybdopterin molybdotransferase MoeA [Propionibacteriaceae bacterium]|jgi:molybdopterin molybdotransferase|nr:molybdopterin molybdotransferase MoeA [Propionibacteriaceae bacterium]